MKKADRKVLTTYVRRAADDLRLRDWTIHMDWDPCEDDAVASVRPCTQRKVAVIQFSATFRDERPESQRHTVVHELIHCHHAAATDIIRLDTLKHLSQEAYDFLFAGFKRQIEYMTDGLADAFAPNLPLIDWPKK